MSCSPQARPSSTFITSRSARRALRFALRAAACAALVQLAAAALAACGVPPSTPDLADPPPTTTAPPALVESKPGPPLDLGHALGSDACKLPAPLKSEDPCSSDADCGPSQPCHAKACVARSKSRPPGPDTMCTKMFACDTADANRCGCYEGRCALVPPGS